MADGGTFVGRYGTSGLLIMAPHNAQHTRDGNPKQAESRTGGFAEAVATQVDATWATTEGILEGDPNWDPHHPFLAFARELATEDSYAFLDVHTMRSRGVDACLGLGQGWDSCGSLCWLLAQHLVAEGLTVALNWPFSAGPRTITYRLQAEGLIGVQLELSVDCFDPGDWRSEASRRGVVSALLAFGQASTSSA